MTTVTTRRGSRPGYRLADFRRAARSRLPREVWDYLAGGAGSESMLDANRPALDALWLRPRVLTGLTDPDTATRLPGGALAAPLGIAPMAYHRLVHPEGEVATARAAGAAGTLFVAGIFASRTVEDIARATDGPLWLQLYWLRDRDRLRRLVGRAEDAGYGALVLTVDAPVVARRPRDARNAFAIPAGVRAVNCADDDVAASHVRPTGDSALRVHSAQRFQPGLSWGDLAWLRSVTELPLVLKGVLTGQDAALAVEHGVAGVVVSNHGGRQLDGAVPAVAALPEVVAAVDGRCAVLVDGAFRRGTDVLKAVALGADTVLLGRPALWGLACDGADGVAAVLRLVHDELTEAMLLAGCPDLAAARDLLDDRHRPWWTA